MRDQIFVSYSRADLAWLNELKAALAQVGLETPLNEWDDSRISPAAEWKREIDEALQTAAAGVLFLSPAFFASEFIQAFELPQLIAAAKRGEIKLFPVIIAPSDHRTVTDTFQAVNEPARPVAQLDPTARASVWQRLTQELIAVSASIGQEQRIEAELIRLDHDMAARADVKAITEKMGRATVDPDLDDVHRENVMVFLEGQRCQALATALMEEMKRPDLTPLRSKAVVRALERVAATEEKALTRAKELTQLFADQTLQMLKNAKADNSIG